MIHSSRNTVASIVNLISLEHGALMVSKNDIHTQGPGTQKFSEAPALAPLLFNKLWLQL